MISRRHNIIVMRERERERERERGRERGENIIYFKLNIYQKSSYLNWSDTHLNSEHLGIG